MKRNNLIHAIVAILLVMLTISCAAIGNHTHTISFYMDDTLLASEEVLDGSKATVRPLPQKENHIFRFWSIDGRTRYTFTKPVHVDIELYAVYSKVQTPVRATIYEKNKVKGYGIFEHTADKVSYIEYLSGETNPGRTITSQIVDGNKVIKTTEKLYQKGSDKPSQITERNYTYSNSSRLTSDIKQTINNGNGTETILTTSYEYDSKNRMTSSIFTRDNTVIYKNTQTYIDESEGNYKLIISNHDLTSDTITKTTYFYRDNLLYRIETETGDKKQYTAVEYTGKKQIQTTYAYDEKTGKYKRHSTTTIITEMDEYNWYAIDSTTTIKWVNEDFMETSYRWSPRIMDYIALHPEVSDCLSPHSMHIIYNHLGSIEQFCKTDIIWEFKDSI